MASQSETANKIEVGWDHCPSPDKSLQNPPARDNDPSPLKVIFTWAFSNWLSLKGLSLLCVSTLSASLFFEQECR